MPLFQRFSGYAGTDVGKVRSNNEDALFIGVVGGPDQAGTKSSLRVTPETPLIAAVVADGVGGSEAGEVASHLAIEVFVRFLKDAAERFSKKNAGPLLEDATLAAHAAIQAEIAERPELAGMATTLSGVVVSADGAWMIHVGDSRVYRFRNKKLEQISMDHSPVGALLRDGRISEEEALNHPLQSYIDQALGGEDADFVPQPDIQPVNLQMGDRLMVCSDGVSDSLYPKQLEDLFRELAGDDSEAFGKSLIETAVRASGHDNTTAAILDVPSLSEKITQIFGRQRTAG